ncbi:hypothetical protein KC361_g63 [Hortaea werneckii]|nr:hypothetical protein KC361_g63 [Hortaea werneckii]
MHVNDQVDRDPTWLSIQAGRSRESSVVQRVFCDGMVGGCCRQPLLCNAIERSCIIRMIPQQRRPRPATGRLFAGGVWIHYQQPYSLVPATLFAHTSYFSFMLHQIHFSDSLELHCCGWTSAA